MRIYCILIHEFCNLNISTPRLRVLLIEGRVEGAYKIKENHKKNQKEPVIIVRKGDSNQYGHEVEIPGGCRVVYRPDKKICGGARVWIESIYKVKVK